MVRTDFPLDCGLDNKVRHTLCWLQIRNSDETPEMWCDRIHAPFKKILEENPSFFSKNEYIQMYDWSYRDGKKVASGPHIHSTNYIYCTVCDSLVYIPDNWTFCLTHSAVASNHLKRCIAENTCSSRALCRSKSKGTGECTRREEFLHVNAQKEYSIWQLKQRIMQYEAEIRRNQLELSPQFQSLSHSEKDKLASVSYVINDISYETFRASMTGPDPAQHNYITMAQHDYTTVARPDPAQHDYTNLGTLSTYFKSMQKGTTVTMPTSRVHRILAQSFYLHPSSYNRISAEEISVGKRTFGEIYARIIQRAYRRYRERPATLANCTWNAIRYVAFCKDQWYLEWCYRRDAKEIFRWHLLTLAGSLLLNLLFQQGYILRRSPPWTTWTSGFKWLDNPEFYKYATKEEYPEIYQYITEDHKNYPEFYPYDTKEGYKSINLVKFSEYDFFYTKHPNRIAGGYIKYLWPGNREKFRKISAQAEKAYNMWVSLDKEGRGFETFNDCVFQKDLGWYTTEKYMLATEKSYRAFLFRNNLPQNI